MKNQSKPAQSGILFTVSRNLLIMTKASVTLTALVAGLCVLLHPGFSVGQDAQPVMPVPSTDSGLDFNAPWQKETPPKPEVKPPKEKKPKKIENKAEKKVEEKPKPEPEKKAAAEPKKVIEPPKAKEPPKMYPLLTRYPPEYVIVPAPPVTPAPVAAATVDLEKKPPAEPAQPIVQVPVTAGQELTNASGMETKIPIETNQPPVQAPAMTAMPSDTNAPDAGQPADFRQIAMIKGINIVGSLKEFNPDGVPLKPGVNVGNDPLLKTEEFSKLVGAFISKPLDEARMRELQKQIVIYFRNHDRPLVDVLYPEQDVSNGMLQVILIEGRLKAVVVEDAKGRPYTNGWSGAKFLRDSIHLKTNDLISEKQVLKDVDWLNRNSFRHVSPVYEPDKQEYGLSSVVLRTEEERQWSADVAYDDSGSQITSNDRLTAGFTWGKAFGLSDNQFRYAFTADPSAELLRVHAFNYYAPLPWQHGLRISGYYLDVKGNSGPSITVKGAAYQASMRYEIPLPRISRYQHDLAFGLDFKSSQNNLFFNQASILNTPTEIFQVAGSYSALLPDAWGRTSFGMQGYYSPGGVTSQDNDAAYNFSTPNAKSEYLYARANLERTTMLPADFSWVVRAMGQVASGNLLPSEQFGLGGFATVRGYEERQGNGDNGYFLSQELRTPPLSIFHLAGQDFSIHDQLVFLGFWDYGEVDTLHGGGHTPFSSMGAGLRYDISRHLSLRFDYGWQLLNAGVNSSHSSRSHIGVVASF